MIKNRIKFFETSKVHTYTYFLLFNFFISIFWHSSWEHIIKLIFMCMPHQNIFDTYCFHFDVQALNLNFYIFVKTENLRIISKVSFLHYTFCYLGWIHLPHLRIRKIFTDNSSVFFIFCKNLAKNEKTMSWKFTDESSVKYLPISKWGRWIRPKFKSGCMINSNFKG